MRTIRWLNASWPLSYSNISKTLLANQYSDLTGSGFLLSSSGSKKISGKYIEKSIDKSVVTDPFGNETESALITYYVSRFSIENSSSLLELNSPPRSLRKFISELHSLLGLGMELSDIQVDPFVWLEQIERSLSPVTVKHISASGIMVPKGGLGKVSVSGKKDIRKEFSKLIGDKKRNIDSIKFVAVINNCRISTELLKTGTVRVSGHVYDGFINEIRACLESSIVTRS